MKVMIVYTTQASTWVELNVSKYNFLEILTLIKDKGVKMFCESITKSPIP